MFHDPLDMLPEPVSAFKRPSTANFLDSWSDPIRRRASIFGGSPTRAGRSFGAFGFHPAVRPAVAGISKDLVATNLMTGASLHSPHQWLCGSADHLPIGHRGSPSGASGFRSYRAVRRIRVVDRMGHAAGSAAG